MGTITKIAIITFVFTLCITCRNHKNEKPSYKLLKIDSLYFRRNYFYDDGMNKEEIRKFENRNPESCIIDENYKLKYNLMSLNLLDKDGNLILQAWDSLIKLNNKTIKYNREYFEVIIEDDDLNSKSSELLGFTIYITNKSKKRIANFRQHYSATIPDLTFITKDLDGDDIDELITMEHWYIINGDNYDFIIYKLSKYI